MAIERDTEPTSLGRVATKQRALEKRRGGTKFHATTAEKLRKLQRHPEGQAFVGATMHLVRRQLEGRDPETPTEDRLRRAIEGMGDDRRVLESIAARYAKLDPDEVVRVVSPRYLHRSLYIPVYEEELVGTLVDAVKGSADTEPGECVHLCCDGGDGRPPDVPDPFDHGLTFAHLYCVDESNPDWLAATSRMSSPPGSRRRWSKPGQALGACTRTRTVTWTTATAGRLRVMLA
jgi:hypothetical protein